MQDIGLPGVMTAFMLAVVLSKKGSKDGLPRSKYWKPIKNFNNNLNVRIKNIENILGSGGHESAIEVNYNDNKIPDHISVNCSDCNNPNCVC